MRFGLFGRGGGADGQAADASRIKAEVRARLGLSDGAAVAVNEILCADPSCPGTETVILVMNPGEKTRAYKAQLPMAELGGQALAAVLGAAPE